MAVLGKGKQVLVAEACGAGIYQAARQQQHPRVDTHKAKFRLKIGKSRIHRWGVFTQDRIPARRNVIEYVGEFVNPVESYRRAKDAKEIYTFKLNEFWVIDGSVGGSGAEFINHSCDPYLRWRRVANRVLCQSMRPIAVGEELTLDYRFSAKAAKVPCCCGSPKCRGTINVTKDGRSQFRSRS